MSDAAKVIDEIDRSIINSLQGGFPLSDEPYHDVAKTLGLPVEELLERLQSMLARKVLTRFGPMFQIERMGGSFVLAALAAPEERYDEVAELVNSFPEVAHNYRREHALNMWFVLATERADGITEVVARIAAATGLEVFPFPKEREFFVEMKLAA